METKKQSGSGFRVIDLSLQTNPDLRFQGNGGSVVTVVLVTEGEVVLTEHLPSPIEPRHFMIDRNCIICLRHNFRRTLDVTESTKGFVVQFDQSLLPTAQELYSPDQAMLYRITDHPSVISVGQAEMEKYLFITRMLLDEADSEPTDHSGMVPCTIELLFMLVVKNARGNFSGSRTLNLVSHKFYGLLEEQFKTEKKVSAYARKLCMTANYLNRIIKQDTGHSASYHIRKRVTTEALRQAQSLQASMKETAYHLGFCDTAHFSKYFKKATGCNFTSFKRKQGRQSEAA